jgi:hypothetical protein
MNTGTGSEIWSIAHNINNQNDIDDNDHTIKKNGSTDNNDYNNYNNNNRNNRDDANTIRRKNSDNQDNKDIEHLNLISSSKINKKNMNQHNENVTDISSTIAYEYSVMVGAGSSLSQPHSVEVTGAVGGGSPGSSHTGVGPGSSHTEVGATVVGAGSSGSPQSGAPVVGSPYMNRSATAPMKRIHKNNENEDIRNPNEIIENSIDTTNENNDNDRIIIKEIKTKNVNLINSHQSCNDILSNNNDSEKLKKISPKGLSYLDIDLLYTILNTIVNIE